MSCEHCAAAYETGYADAKAKLITGDHTKDHILKAAAWCDSKIVGGDGDAYWAGECWEMLLAFAALQAKLESLGSDVRAALEYEGHSKQYHAAMTYVLARLPNTDTSYETLGDLESDVSSGKVTMTACRNGHMEIYWTEPGMPRCPLCAVRVGETPHPRIGKGDHSAVDADMASILQASSTDGLSSLEARVKALEDALSGRSGAAR